MGEIDGEINLKKDEVVEVVYVDSRNLSSFEIAFNHREILERFLDVNIDGNTYPD